MSRIDFFADLFSATIFRGEQVIKADKLIEINTEDIHINDVNVKKKNQVSDATKEEKITDIEELEITKKYRDLRCWIYKKLHPLLQLNIKKELNKKGTVKPGSSFHAI